MSEIDYQQAVPTVTLPEPSLKDIKDIEQTLKENLRNIMVKDSLIKQVTEQVLYRLSPDSRFSHLLGLH